MFFVTESLQVGWWSLPYGYGVTIAIMLGLQALVGLGHFVFGSTFKAGKLLSLCLCVSHHISRYRHAYGISIFLSQFLTYALAPTSQVVISSTILTAATSGLLSLSAFWSERDTAILTLDPKPPPRAVSWKQAS